MASPLLEFVDVTIGYGEKVILRQINFRLERNQAVVIVGQSGEGKTSLLKTAAGLLAPLSGSVLIEGNSLYDAHGDADAQLMKRLGMLFQKNALFDSMTAEGNLEFPLQEIGGLDPEEILNRIQWYLGAVGLGESRKLFPNELSGGMQKRLGIARALALKPELVLYDDPTAGLDPITSRRIVQLIVDLKSKEKGGVLASLNDMNRAYQLADQILLVTSSQVLNCGNPEQTRGHSDPRVQQFIKGELRGPLAGL